MDKRFTKPYAYADMFLTAQWSRKRSDAVAHRGLRDQIWPDLDIQALNTVTMHSWSISYFTLGVCWCPVVIIYWHEGKSRKK